MFKLAWALIGALVGASLCLAADLRFDSSNATTEQHDVVTFVGAVGEQFRLCWTQKTVCLPNTECVEAYNVQFRWYRTEDGSSGIGPLLHRSEWIAAGTLQWCSLNQTIPQPGHWVYEARFCGPPIAPATEPTCNVHTSIDSGTASGLGEHPWWIYSYAPRPGSRPMWPSNIKVVSPTT